MNPRSHLSSNMMFLTGISQPSNPDVGYLLAETIQPSNPDVGYLLAETILRIASAFCFAHICFGRFCHKESLPRNLEYFVRLPTCRACEISISLKLLLWTWSYHRDEWTNSKIGQIERDEKYLFIGRNHKLYC
jgi:hypothetical protein